MWFWWFMMATNCFIPALMIVLGWLLWKHYPKEINGMLGYRTKRSMKNAETWKFGNEYCGRLWNRLGLLLIIPSIIVLIPLFTSSEETLANVCVPLIVFQLVLLVGSIIPTEIALKKKFS
ncbi:MAG: SdpI family protein [Butyrivibrio sp.]|nr:SdpI family protein [Butyrivibrio sp.]